MKMDAKLCPHCQKELQSEREQFINCCFVCRRYGLLLGVWPEKGAKMEIILTDEQIARVFQLCAEIVAVRDMMPAAPHGHNVRLEVARAVRVSLSQHNAALVELAAILQPKS
jgi:hypothetical protein